MIAVHDPDRLAVLHDLAILDTPPEPAFDDIAQLAAACCNSAIAAVNFVDDGRHWTATPGRSRNSGCAPRSR